MRSWTTAGYRISLCSFRHHDVKSSIRICCINNVWATDFLIKILYFIPNLIGNRGKSSKYDFFFYRLSETGKAETLFFNIQKWVLINLYLNCDV